MFNASENNIKVVMTKVTGLTFKLDNILSTVVKNHDMLTKVLAKLKVETAMHATSTQTSLVPLKVKTIKYWRGADKLRPAYVRRPAYCIDQQNDKF